MHAVCGELFEKLQRPGAPLTHGLLLRVGELCAGAEDAAEDADLAADTEPAVQAAVAAQAALGKALRHVGPETVLQVLPLNLVEVRCC